MTAFVPPHKPAPIREQGPARRSPAPRRSRTAACVRCLHQWDRAEGIIDQTQFFCMGCYRRAHEP